MRIRLTEMLALPRFLVALALILVPLVGCGGGVDMDQPAEIDPIMEQEAELSDAYMMEQEGGM